MNDLDHIKKHLKKVEAIVQHNKTITLNMSREIKSLHKDLDQYKYKVYTTSVLITLVVCSMVFFASRL